MHGIETQPVEPVLLEPVERIVDIELAHDWLAEVDRLAPRGIEFAGEEFRRITVQLIAGRAEVIVDDIEQNHQPMLVCTIDERLQLLGRAVGPIRGEREDSVVAPVTPPDEVGDRHQLDRSHAEFREVGQALDGPGEGAGGREGADMQLVDHGLAPGPSRPGVAAPG